MLIQTHPPIRPRQISKPLWQRILAEGYKKPIQLLQDLELPDLDVSADVLFPTRVPRPFVEKMQKGNSVDPLLLQVLPQSSEFLIADGFSDDPLAERAFNPVSGLLHKYSSRVLLTLQSACAINCRYCFRRHFAYEDNRINQPQIKAIIDYIGQHKAINEVVLSGGDPLMIKDGHLADLIERLEKLPQLQRLRFHSRLPVVIPERITNEWVDILDRSRFQSILVVHSNHPNELDENFNIHIQKLIARGIHVFNQGVLLKGINDDSTVLAELSEKLFSANVLPYYLFLLDKVNGASHFEVEVKYARTLIREMAAKLPGYLVPKLSRETPGLASKDMWV